jgi:hypothetical protein
VTNCLSNPVKYHEIKPAMQSTQNALLLQCLICKHHYSIEDVRALRYFPSTGICSKCYEAMQALPHQQSCFGKRNVVRDGKVVKFGFDQSTKECSSECVDRGICKLFVKLRRTRRGEN